MDDGPSSSRPQKGLLELTRADRSTRGKRYKAALADEEEKADQEFWNQDFFQGERAAWLFSDRSRSLQIDARGESGRRLSRGEGFRGRPR